MLCACHHWLHRDAVACRVCGRILQPEAVAYVLLLPGQEPVRLGSVATIGRGAPNTVQLDDPSVSRTHARIFVDDGHAVLEDVGSSYGTTVNGRAVTEPLELHDGTTFRVGDTYLTIARRRGIFESVHTRV